MSVTGTRGPFDSVHQSETQDTTKYTYLGCIVATFTESLYLVTLEMLNCHSWDPAGIRLAVPELARLLHLSLTDMQQPCHLKYSKTDPSWIPAVKIQQYFKGRVTVSLCACWLSEDNSPGPANRQQIYLCWVEPHSHPIR
jgi:hypothetical protein